MRPSPTYFGLLLSVVVRLIVSINALASWEKYRQNLAKMTQHTACYFVWTGMRSPTHSDLFIMEQS